MKGRPPRRQAGGRADLLHVCAQRAAPSGASSGSSARATRTSSTRRWSTLVTVTSSPSAWKWSPHQGQTAQLVDDPAGDRAGIAVALDGEQVEEVGEVRAGGDQIAAVRLLAEGLHHLVVLIPDLAHQLLQDILHGQQALGAAVLVHHDGHVGLFLLQRPQQEPQLRVGGGVVDRRDAPGDAALPVVAGGVEVLFMDDAHDVVHVLVVHRQAGVAALREGGGDLLHGGGVLHRHDVHPGGEDVPGLQVAELDGGADQLALVLVQAALVLRLGHHGDQLLLGDAGVLGGAEDQVQQLLPLGEEEVQRPQDQQEHPEYGGGEHGKALRMLLGQALGGDLAEDQHHQRQHHRGDGGAVRGVQLGEEHRAHGGRGDVHDVVADEDGGDQPVVVVRQLHGQLGLFVPGVGPALHPDLVHAGERGLRGGEIGGHRHEHDDGCDH